MGADPQDRRGAAALDGRDYVSRCRSALSELAGVERADAERVLALVSARHAGELSDEPLARRELVGLIERLGRRGSAAIPLASLARALSADLRGDRAVRAESLAACERALAMLGL